jgi:hypothetical protein
MALLSVSHIYRLVQPVSALHILEYGMDSVDVVGTAVQVQRDHVVEPVVRDRLRVRGQKVQHASIEQIALRVRFCFHPSR